jgi:RTX calcium-binding nonapeptide repeat (4 copies)
LSERIIVNPYASSPTPITYPTAPTPTSSRNDSLQNWLNSQLNDANDSVFVTKEGDDQYKIDINGEVEMVSGEELKKLKFDLKGGKDTMVVGEDVPIDITVNMGDGDDRFWGGGGNDNVNGGGGNDKIYGRGGDDTMNGGAGNDEIWGLLGKNTLIGGSGNDTFMTGSGPQNLSDFTGSEDSHPTTTTAPSTQAAATPVSPTTATPTPATTAPTATAPTATAPAAATAAPTSGVIINGDNNSVTYNAAPAGTASITNAAATSTANGIAKNANFDIAASVAKGNSGLTETSTGVYTGSLGGFNVTVTQPGGAGTPISMKMTPSSGALKDATIDITLNPDKSSTINVSGGSLTAEQTKSINDLVNKMQLDGLDNAFTSVKKKKGGGSATTGAGAAAGGAGEGMSGSVDGSSGAIDGGSGLDGTSGLDTSGSDGSDSWFMVLAVAMGTIMNKMAEKMIGLLNKIKAAGDDPPYALTAEFQATAQMLSFMQQAFMTALNSLGESIKTSVTAGGAAR